MEDNEQNEKLCRLLGIKPKYCSNDYYQKHLKSPNYYNLSGCLSNEKADIYFEGDFDIEIYPNLSSPSNFIKLLENIKIDGIELCDWLICYAGSFCNRVDFIDSLIKIIEDEKGYISGLTKDISSIQHQAQQTEWEY